LIITVGAFFAMEGFDLIIVLPPSSRRQAPVNRTVAFLSVQIPHLHFVKKKTNPVWGGILLSDGGI
jgi:hypothetical protein